MVFNLSSPRVHNSVIPAVWLGLNTSGRLEWDDVIWSLRHRKSMINRRRFVRCLLNSMEEYCAPRGRSSSTQFFTIKGALKCGPKTRNTQQSQSVFQCFVNCCLETWSCSLKWYCGEELDFQCSIQGFLTSENNNYSVIARRFLQHHCNGCRSWRRRGQRIEYVRSFSNVFQLPDQWHRYHLVTCHWLLAWKPWFGICVTDLAIGTPHVWNLRHAEPPQCSGQGSP